MIKAIFKPTIIKVIATVIFFMAMNSFAYHFEPVSNSPLLFPCFNPVCGRIQDSLDKNSLNSYPEEVKNKLSSEELLDISDNWIPVVLFCIFPLRIIYYYGFVCLMIFCVFKVNQRKRAKDK